MDWKIDSIGEGTDIEQDRGFVHAKKVRFTVNGRPHTLRISMSDFDRGNTNALVKKEAEKIIAAYGKN